MAISVPIAVEASVASTASSTDVVRALFSSSILKACCQYSSVKPSLIANVSLSLGVSANEKTAMTAIGTSM